MTQFGDTYMNGRNGHHPPLRVLAAEALDRQLLACIEQRLLTLQPDAPRGRVEIAG